MKVMMKALVEFGLACAQLRNTPSNAPVAFCAALRINAKRAQSFVESFNEERDAIVVKFADRDEKGEPIQTAPGVYQVRNGQAAMKAIEDLGAVEVDFELQPFDPAHLPETISPAHFNALMDMIELAQGEAK